MDVDVSDNNSTPLPLHHFTEHLTENLKEMHRYVQTLLMQKLGPEARNVIAAELARLSREEGIKLEQPQLPHKDSDYIASHLSEVGKTDKGELELLNEYRERYAEILAELIVARDRLIELEKTMERTAGAQLSRRLDEDLSEISEDEVVGHRRRWEEKRRRRSSPRSDEFSEESGDDVEKRKAWLQRRRSSTGPAKLERRSTTPGIRDWRKWN
jgi:hypothetical protein